MSIRGSPARHHQAMKEAPDLSAMATEMVVNRVQLNRVTDLNPANFKLEILSREDCRQSLWWSWIEESAVEKSACPTFPIVLNGCQESAVFA